MLPFNPFFDLLEIVRGPILGDQCLGTTWLGALVYSVASVRDLLGIFRPGPRPRDVLGLNDGR